VSRRRRAAFAAIACLAIAVPAASAGDGITLRSIDTTRLPEVRLVVALDTVPAGGTPPTFQVRENGVPVGGVTVGSAASSTSYALVVDTSQSMKGRAMRSAIDGASAFLRTVKGGDRVAVFGFGSTVQTVQPFTDSIDSLDRAVSGLAIDLVQGTALNDGVTAAARALASEDPARRRVMIVLTDGDDTTSAATAAIAQDTAIDTQTTVYTIGIASDDFQPAELKTLAAKTGGTYAEGTPQELEQVYRAIADDLARTFVLGYGSISSGRVALEVDAGGAAIVRTNYVGGKAVRVKTGDGLVPASITHAAWSAPALAGATLLLIMLGVFRVLRPRPRKTIAQRLAPYADSRTHAVRVSDFEGPNSAFGLLKTLGVMTEKILGKLEVWKGMAALIERADLPLKTAELFYMMCGAGVVFGFIVRLILGMPTLVTLPAMGVGFLIPYLFVRLKARTRCKAFDNQLPDILISMAASLKAGHSFNQAMESTIKEGAEPAAKEFGRVASEVRLGRAADEALEGMAKRLGSSNFEFVVMSVNVQRQVGGSMAELLDGVGETVRQRQQFMRKVKALCAMGRMSAYTLVALPIIMGAAISAINPSYMAPLFTTSTGHVLLIVALVSISFGALILKKIVSFRV
jgi:tight adherence protein B